MSLIGVSIAVPDPCGREVQEYRMGLGDEAAELIPTHITLVPPTSVPDAQVDALCRHLASAAGEHSPFEVHLRGTGTFRPVSPVVFVGVVGGSSECELLAKSIRTGPLEMSLDFRYHPHVTIAHHVPESTLDRAFVELAPTDCRFEVSGFWLYAFDEVEGWVRRREFTLGVTPG